LAHVARARHDGRALGDARYLELRYEDLLRETERSMRAVSAFLGEPFDPRMVLPTPLHSRHFPATFGARRNTHVSDSVVVVENHGKWRTAMAPPDLELFETIAGDVLGELGYERASSIR